MSNVLKLDKSVDLYISMSWTQSKNNHGICGHLFEIIDYYLLLKHTYNVKILIGESISPSIYIKAIIDKYDLTESTLQKLIDDTTFTDRPKILIGKNILFVDGLLKTHFQQDGVVLLFENIFTFRCCKYCTHHDLEYKNVHVLQDMRVYNDLDNTIALNYIKKINFGSYRNNYIKPNNDTALIYATKNCRGISKNDISSIIEQYNYKKYIIITDDANNDYSSIDKCHVIHPPVDNLFNMFDNYIYTPIKKQFDCSPRLIAECKFYNREVIYHDIGTEYMRNDTGLYYRWKDITNGVERVTLTSDDPIFDIINETI